MNTKEELTQLPDSELLTKIKNGQGDLFVILYDRHAPAAFRHILFRSGNKETAEDVVSQTFLHIWDYLRTGKTIQSFRSFLFQTARNIFIDITRKKESKNLSLEAFLEDDTQQRREPTAPMTPLTDLLVNEEIQALKRALRRLPPHYQEMLTLRYLDELSISEIAQVTGKNSGAIYVSLHRGTRLLRQALVEAQLPHS